MTFTVTYAQRDGGAAHLRLAGELDLSTAPELNAAIDRLAADGQRELLVDLSELTFCDSSGIAAFVRGDNRAAAEGGWLRITGATGRVARVLQVTGVAELLRYEADVSGPASSSGP
ncbi:STAS domain-containing protein [Micromonospora sp. DR5-3]|uniref:STAS domain-containing protein n=1 Tax=unclassified Micromonospora TaxID=2617518 RepID=UPI0011DB3C8A|nr:MULTISPECIES: STAS domain-containing protein [unclassified Micromonospora]MCW3818104.1 STAS domain-containing protein [Micromonospora sp. DR5-3]TYC22292.1 STAS domain-containing protein [Micromonospora sp. MP36]